MKPNLNIPLGLSRLSILALCVGCGPAVGSDDSGAQEGSTSSAASSTSASPGTETTAGPSDASTTTDPPGTTGVGESTSAGDTSSSDGSSSSFTGVNFIDDPTEGCGAGDFPDGVLAHCSIECTVWDQDCGEGEVCRPWANDGGDIWNATLCRPVDPKPAQVGEPCTAEGSPVSGLDSCDVGLMCWNVSDETLEGECVEFCGGTELEPTCDDALDTCSIFNDGWLPVCLPACDPLASTCDNGFGCYPGSQGDFVCVREGEQVSLDEVFHPYCPAGSFAATGEQVAGCSVEEPCCSAYCDLTGGMPCGAEFECLPLSTPYAMQPNLGACVSVE